MVTASCALMTAMQNARHIRYSLYFQKKNLVKIVEQVCRYFGSSQYSFLTNPVSILQNIEEVAQFERLVIVWFRHIL